MNIIIIEDEIPAYNRLEKILQDILPDVIISPPIDGISSAQTWFSNNEAPDVVFLDIHLADGSAFDLLKVINIQSPIIFTTAYDNYAIEAFKTSGIDYLLKPVKKEELIKSLQKLDQLKNFLNRDKKETNKLSTEYKKRFLIRFGEHIKTIDVNEIAYCYSENKATFARMFDGRNFPMDHNLDALETLLDPQDFFRINRQYIINLKAIEDMRTYTKARVIVKLKPPVKDAPVVSSERAADFKLWLAGDL